MSWSMPLGLAALAGLAWLVLGWTYNLYLHPLRRFPGPKLAAMTRLYEFWYDVVLDGRFLHQMERMHQEYGTPPLPMHARCRSRAG